MLGDRFAKRSGAAEVYVTEADSVVVDEGDIDARPSVDDGADSRVQAQLRSWRSQFLACVAEQRS